MAVTSTSIFTQAPDISTDKTTGRSQPVTLAAADYTGISANYVLVHTAGTNGSYVDRIRCIASGSNIATVARLFANNGGSVGTATNNCPLDQMGLPSTTASNNSSTVTVFWPIGIRLNANEKLYVGIATAVSAGWTFVAEAGQY